MRTSLRIRWYRFSRNLRQILLVSLGFTVAVTACWRFGWFNIQESEQKAYDKALTQFTQLHERSKNVVVLAIDDQTLQLIDRDRWGSWPFYRALWGLVVKHLHAEGARALVFDLVMDTPQTGDGDYQLAEAIRSTGLPVYLGFAVQRPDDPDAQAKLPHVTARNLLPREPIPRAIPAKADDSAPPEPEDAFAIGDVNEERAELPAVDPAKLWAWQLERLAFPVKAASLPTLEKSYVALDSGVRAKAMRLPLPPTAELLSALSGTGLVEPEEDPDGVLRETHFAYTDGINRYVTLPVAAAADLLGAREVSIGDGALRIGLRTLAINPDGSAKIDFGGTLDERFSVISLAALLHDYEGHTPRALPAGFFRDKVVVVGGVALATQDTKPTPFASIQSGVVKQAATIDALLGGHFITDAPLWLAALVTFLVAFFSASLGKVFRSAFINVGWPIALYAGFYAVTGLALRYGHLHLPATMPVWAGIASSLTSTAFARLFADRKRERLKESFVRYLDRTLVEQMDISNELPRLEGEAREITAFFSDIRGFSSFSEGLKNDPQKLVRMLNTYLTRVSAALVREGGCLDKYIGDAVVCLYGAPLRQQDHAVRACRGALAAQAEVAKLREEFRAQGLPDVFTRIGLNSGVMMVGNFGSDQLFDYTAMGDDMNLASRLEGANKAFETSIMIGEKTWALAKDHIEVRELDRVRVAGKKEPVRIFELLGMKGQISETQRTVAREYETALEIYRAAKFDEALALLTTLAERAPDDGPTRALRARCEKYLAHPPAGFDGVANLEK